MNYLPNARRAGAIAVAAVAVLLAGCENMSERQKGTATGAGVGAVAGAVISSATGGKAGTGAAAGGVLGAVVGNVWSKRQEDRRVAMEQATRGTGVEVDTHGGRPVEAEHSERRLVRRGQRGHPARNARRARPVCQQPAR